MRYYAAALVELALLATTAIAQSCGSQSNGALCPTGCCSQFGFCGTTAEFCLTSMRCQSQCVSIPYVGRVSITHSKVVYLVDKRWSP